MDKIPSLRQLMLAKQRIDQLLGGYIADAAPGGALNPELTPQNIRQAGEYAAMAPNPIGDIASGMLAVDDARRGNYGSAALNSIGMLPFVPAMGGVMYKVGDKILDNEGRMGTVVKTRVFPGAELPAWEQKRKELHDQAFQGYMAGQHTFEQASAIYDELLNRNKDLLKRLFSQRAGEPYSVPKVLFEGETRARTVPDSQIQKHFTGPKGVE